MNYPLFKDTIIILLNPKLDSPIIKHIPNNKYKISEDLSIKIKDIFSNIDCNIIFGGTINEQNVIGLFGDEKFRQQSSIDIFYKYLIKYSNWDNIVENIKKDIKSNGKISYFNGKNSLKFIPNSYTINKKVSEYDYDIVFNNLRKYQDSLFSEIVKKEDKHNTQYLEILLSPALKQHKIIPKSDNEIKLSIEELKNLIIKNLESPIKEYFDGKIFVSELKNSKTEFCLSIENPDLNWDYDYGYISDFKSQYGYEPDESDMYWEYDQNKYDSLQLLIENILEPLDFEISDWSISTEYKFIECILKYNKN